MLVLTVLEYMHKIFFRPGKRVSDVELGIFFGNTFIYTYRSFLDHFQSTPRIASAGSVDI